MPSLYEMEYPAGVKPVLEGMRKNIAKTMGVTLTGNRLTVRFTQDDKNVDIHMIIASVTTPEDSRKATESSRVIENALSEEDEEKLYFIEHGEHSQ